MAGIIHREHFPVGSSPDSIQWDVWNAPHVLDDGAGGLLVFGPIADGEFLVRDGDEIVGAAGGGGEALSVTIHLTGAEILTLFGNPIEAIAAPGAGKFLVPLPGGFGQFAPGVARYFGGNSLHTVAGDMDVTSQGALAIDIGNLVTFFQASTPRPAVLWGEPAVTAFFDMDLTENQPLMLETDLQWILTGPIVTATLAAGGSGYAPGDTGGITSPNSVTETATYVVTTVDGGGAVTGFTITAAGDPAYDTGQNPLATVATTGIGTGFTVNVTAVPPADGELDVLLYYAIRDVLA